MGVGLHVTPERGCFLWREGEAKWVKEWRGGRATWREAVRGEAWQLALRTEGRASKNKPWAEKWRWRWRPHSTKAVVERRKQPNPWEDGRSHEVQTFGKTLWGVQCGNQGWFYALLTLREAVRLKSTGLDSRVAVKLLPLSFWWIHARADVDDGVSLHSVTGVA